MKINIKAGGLDLTPSLKVYVEKKMSPLSKILLRLEEGSEARADAELLRTTKHHHKGSVFCAKIDIILPRKIFRAQKEASDIREAIDLAKDKLFIEIEKYKEKILKTRS